MTNTIVKHISWRELSTMTSHPEYGCRPLGSLAYSSLDWSAMSWLELSLSIKHNGITKPLLIAKYPSKETMLDDGTHRAYIAIQQKLERVPVITYETDNYDPQVLRTYLSHYEGVQQ